MRGLREVKGVLAKRVICFIVIENAIWGVVFFIGGGRMPGAGQEFAFFLLEKMVSFFDPPSSFSVCSRHPLSLFSIPSAPSPPQKKKSDLRVRHREETRVVSRLTMENMNLASRCREAISQVAMLRKELLVYQKRQGEHANLAREVEWLRRQVGINTGGTTTRNDDNSTVANYAGGVVSTTFPSNAVDNDQQEQKWPPTMSSMTTVSPDGDNSSGNRNGINRSDSPATDLDRIMSQQFRKDSRQQQSSGPASSSSAATAALVATTTTKGGALMNSSSSSSALPVAPLASKQLRSVARGNNLLMTSSNAKIPISVNSKNVTTPSSTSATSAIASAVVGPSSAAHKPNDDEFDADIDMVDFFAKSQSLLLNDNVGNNDGIPLSSGPSSSQLLPGGGRTHHVRRARSSGTDDRMPDDVIPISSASSGAGLGGGEMEGISVKAAGGCLIKYPKNASSSSSSVGPGGDSNLLSSLDAFEASFASAFPETSFSISSEIAPLSSASLDMAFDVPDFDPFFKNLANSNINNNNNNNAGMGNRQEATSLGGVGGGGGGISGGSTTWDDGHGIGKNNDGGASTMKSQMMQDLFPESAMNFKSSPKLDNLAFDSNPMMGFELMERTRGLMIPTSQQHHHPTATTSVVPERLDLAVSRAQARGSGNLSSVVVSASDPSRDEIRPVPSQTKPRVSGGAIGNNGPLSHIHRSRLTSPLSPQSMSAEIEQLDAIADLASRNIGGCGADGGLTTSTAAAAVAANNTAPPPLRMTVRSSVRKVKQPVSYAEPSTKSKLRRGDVLFPKVDSSDKTDSKAGGGEGRTSPTTELNRIMDQMAASSSSSSSSSPPPQPSSDVRH